MAEKQATLLLRIKESGSEALSNVTDLIFGIGKAAVAAGVAIAGFVGLAVTQFREQELATNQLNQAMIQQGIYTSDLSKTYIDMAGALQKVTTFGDEQIISAQAIIQSHIGQREITNELMMATLDLAAKTGDLDGAAQMVGKSIGSNTNALSRQGVEIDANATVTEKYAQVISGLNGLLGGQAVAAASGLGSLTQMKNAFSDIMETVGERFAPIISLVARGFTSLATNLQSNKQWIDALDGSVKVVSTSFVWLKAIALTFAQTVGVGVVAAVQALQQAVTGQFSAAKQTAIDAGAAMNEIITENANTLNAELAVINLAKEEAEFARQEKEIADLAASEARKTGVRMAELAKQTELERKAAADQKIIEDKADADKKKADAKRLADRDQFLSHMSALQSSHNSVMATIGKAAAIAQITISTGQAAAAGSAYGGPILGPVFAALAYAAGAAQIAKVAGVQLAEGGIVKARPGGTQATIGEGGRDEAVIPLENGMIPGGGGGGITINISGPFMGDESSARELARIIDQQLFNMRRNNEAISFDSGVL